MATPNNHDTSVTPPPADSIDFVSKAAHELRTPITAIRGYLSLLLEDAYGTIAEQPKKTLQTTFDLATHLATLVDDLLETSRFDQGRVTLDLELVQLEDVVVETVNQFSPAAAKKSVTLAFARPPQPLPKIQADRIRLLQAIGQLCMNAVAYTPNGRVNLAVSETPDAVSLTIIDTGIGIPSDDQPQLFSKFFRVKNEATRGIPGTGLGLWLAKQFIEMMDGDISLVSQEGQGTTVTVNFPVKK